MKNQDGFTRFMNALKRIYNSSLFTINIVFIVLLILSAFSDRVSPDKIVYFSFLGMVFPFILVINLCFVVWWLLFRRWKQLLTCLIAIFICWGAVNTYFPLHLKTEKLPDDAIKILTYNVMGFHHSTPHTEKKPNPVLQYIVDSEADVVCIQEHRTYRNSRHLSPVTLRRALRAYPYSHFHRIKTADPDLGIYGLSIYSKYPIVSTEKIDFNSMYNGAFKAVLNVDGKKVTVINCHLETNNLSNEDRRQYDAMMKDFDSKKLDEVAGRTVKKLKPAFKTRAAQAKKIAELIRKEENPYIVVCGDFNDTPISYARKTIKGNLKDAFADTGSGLGITYNRNRFYFRIDYILHSKNIKAYNCTVGELKDSDHYPVYTWLKLQ